MDSRHSTNLNSLCVLLACAYVHGCPRLCACCTVQAIAVVHLLMLSSMLTAGTEAGIDPPHITTVIETLSIEVFAGVLVLLSLRTTVDYEEVRLDCSPSRTCHLPLHLTFSVPMSILSHRHHPAVDYEEPVSIARRLLHVISHCISLSRCLARCVPAATTQLGCIIAAPHLC
jgi:hypothetical protein